MEIVPSCSAGICSTSYTGVPIPFLWPEEHSGLDLNGIWNGVRFAWRKPDAQQRQMLVQASHLGFGSDCAWLLTRHRGLSSQEAQAYLVEIEQKEAETGQ